MDNRTRILYAVLLALGLAAPAVVYPIFLMKALCFALFASAFNLLIGFTGLLSFGHAMFLGTAGYICGHAVKVMGFPTEAGILAGVAASALTGYLVGALAIRRQGIYFAMITLAFSQMLYFIYLQAPFTGGEDGLQSIPRQSLLGLVNLDDDLAMYYFTFAIVIFGFWVIHRTVHSPFGQVLKAIRENEPRALSLGYDVDRYKLLAFVLSAALSGLAGATKALVFKFETLSDVHWSMSGEVVLMTLLGGMGTILGPTVGAFIVVTLQNYLASLEGWVTVITGAIFVICVLAFRRGVIGELAQLFREVTWSIAPVIDWLMHKGRHIASPEALVGELCEHVRAAGLPIERVGFFFQTLHPQYEGIALFWNGEQVAVLRADKGLRKREEYLTSPAARIVAGERVIRRRLERDDCPLDFPVLGELKAQGMTDYVMSEVVYSTGQRNSVSLSTRRPGGFSDHDIDEVQRLLHPFALVMENYNHRELARTLLETYLGRSAGLRVLDGQIERGDGEEIDAVIWFSDLRESTPLAARLGGRKFLELLNDYFEATAGAVLEHDGEVLRFIGDASLAVFPVSSAAERRATCERAAGAARSARAKVAEANARRAAAGLPTFSHGVGLHLGQVLYGNIGTPNRLEFSVIGAAANETARIESLCKETGRDVVASGGVIEALGERWDSLGSFELRGVGRAIEVYAMPAA